MKVAALLIACLIAGSYAQDATEAPKTTDFLTQLKNTLKATVDHVKENGKTVLQGLLAQVQQSGSQLLQSTLLKLLEQMGTQTGKRDLAKIEEVRERLAKFVEMMKAKKQEAKGVMAKGLEKLEAIIEKIKNMSFLKQHISKTHKEIDEAVAHHVTVTRRFVVDLGKDLLETLKQTGAQLAQEVLAKLLGGLVGSGKKRLLVDGLDLKGLGESLLETLKKTGSELLQKVLIQTVGGLTGSGKRELHPFLQGLVDFFKPHVQTVVGSVGALGETLKGHATNLWNTVQTHAGQLQGKLQGHVDELKGHGQTLLGHGKAAVDALKAAVTDILSQTLTNAKGTIGEAGKTVGEASKVISGHVVDSLKNGSE